jgi:quercetin dioxygenase-like cupin family protein
MLERGSLDASASPSVGERFHELVRVRNVVVEEIVSSARPASIESRQPQDEWVVVLEGAATLDVDGAAVALTAGEWLLIRADTPHRVLETDAGTRWLAVHVHPAGS